MPRPYPSSRRRRRHSPMSLFGQLFGGSFALDRSAPEAPSTREMRFTQLFLEVALSRDPVLPATAASPCTGGGTIATASDPADGVALAGATAPVLWILCHFDTGDRAYAYEVLNDPSTYHAGQKLARILSISDVSRHGSDDFGGVIVSRTTVELLDQDGHFRTVENTQTIRGRSVELFIADNATRLALGVAKRIGHFVIDDYQPRADFTFTLELVGFIGSQRSAWRKQKFACSRLWPAGVFSDLPLELVNTPEPLWYGPINDESLADSASAAPVLTGDAARGSYLEGGVYR